MVVSALALDRDSHRVLAAQAREGAACEAWLGGLHAVVYRGMDCNVCHGFSYSLMIIARHEGAALADQEVEIRALVGLEHMIEVELPVAAIERRLGRLPLAF